MIYFLLLAQALATRLILALDSASPTCVESYLLDASLNIDFKFQKAEGTAYQISVVKGEEVVHQFKSEGGIFRKHITLQRQKFFIFCVQATGNLPSSMQFGYRLYYNFGGQHKDYYVMPENILDDNHLAHIHGSLYSIEHHSQQVIASLEERMGRAQNLRAEEVLMNSRLDWWSKTECVVLALATGIQVFMVLRLLNKRRK